MLCSQREYSHAKYRYWLEEPNRLNNTAFLINNEDHQTIFKSDNEYKWKRNSIIKSKASVRSKVNQLTYGKASSKIYCLKLFEKRYH